MSDRVVTGGKAHLTAVHDKGPQGQAIKGKRLREIRGGDNGPANGWYAFDCTPHDAEGTDFGPMPKSEERKKAEDRRNPEFEGVPSWDGSDSHQAVRLTWENELTSGTADLANEYANHGCTPRIKTRGGEGKLINLRFEAANGVVIAVQPSVLNVGRR